MVCALFAHRSEKHARAVNHDDYVVPCAQNKKVYRSEMHDRNYLIYSIRWLTPVPPQRIDSRAYGKVLIIEHI